MRIGDCWSIIRATLEPYSTKTIKEILGRAGLPVFKIEYPGTHKGPVLDGADALMRQMDEDSRDKLVVACVEEIVAFENRKNENASENGQAASIKSLQELEQSLARLGYGIAGKNVFPLTLQLDLETASLPVEVSEAIAEALQRYRDGRYAGAITSACGAVDKITQSLFFEKSLGDHKAASYQERVSKAFATLEADYCKPFLEKRIVPNEVKLIWENHKKSVSQAAYVLGAYRREYSDAHGEQHAPPEFVQKTLDCSVFILRSFIGVKV